MIVALLLPSLGVTSCKKASVANQQIIAEPWPVLSVIEGTEWSAAAASFTLYSDRRLVVRRVPNRSDSNSQPTFWTRTLSVEEFELVDKAADQALRSRELRAQYDFGVSTVEYNLAFTNLYFGAKNKGAIITIDGIHLLGVEYEQPADIPILFHENKLPEEFRSLWKSMLCVNGGDLEPWHPSFIAVGFWRSEEVQEGAAAVWPDDWPKPEFSAEPAGAEPDWTCVKLPLAQLERLSKLMGLGESLVSVQVGTTKYLANYCAKYPGAEIWAWLNQPPEIVAIDSFCQCCPPPPPPKFKFNLPSKIPIGK